MCVRFSMHRSSVRDDIRSLSEPAVPKPQRSGHFCHDDPALVWRDLPDTYRRAVHKAKGVTSCTWTKIDHMPDKLVVDDSREPLPEFEKASADIAK